MREKPLTTKPSTSGLAKVVTPSASVEEYRTLVVTPGGTHHERTLYTQGKSPSKAPSSTTARFTTNPSQSRYVTATDHGKMKIKGVAVTVKLGQSKALKLNSSQELNQVS